MQLGRGWFELYYWTVLGDAFWPSFRRNLVIAKQRSDYVSKTVSWCNLAQCWPSLARQIKVKRTEEKRRDGTGRDETRREEKRREEKKRKEKRREEKRRKEKTEVARFHHTYLVPNTAFRDSRSQDTLVLITSIPPEFIISHRRTNHAKKTENASKILISRPVNGDIISLFVVKNISCKAKTRQYKK